MRYRSLFWAFLMIAAGLIWLLIQVNTIPVENLWSLLYIWPFFLLAAGVGLIVRSRWPGIRGVVSGLLVLGMVLSIVFAAQLGWNRPPAWDGIHFNDWGGISFGDNNPFNGSVRGSGVMASQTRNVANFNTIEINYPVELTVQQGSSVSVKVDAEDNLLPQLATRVSGSNLYIENSERDWTKRVNPTRSVKVSVTVPTLQQVDFPSAGTLTVESFQADQLRISISGAGKVDLNQLSAQSLTVALSGAGSISAYGKVDNLNLQISGLGSFQGPDLACRSADIDISGAGSATVWAINNLHAGISGTGSVRYYGSPTIQRDVSGLGSVVGLGNK